MKLLPPIGFRLYGGATITSCYDTSGALYWSCSVFYPDKRFGMAVFRQIGEKTATFVFELPTFCSGRGTLSADGRITAFDGELAYTFVIPGFRPINAGSAVPVSLPAQNGTDASARTSAAQALATALTALKKAQEALVIANSKPSVDIVWQKALDAAYGLLKEHHII